MTKSEDTLKAVEKLSIKSLPKAVRLMFTAVSEDIKNMDTRITKIEKNLDVIQVDIKSIKDTQEQQAGLFKAVLDAQQNKQKFWADVLKSGWFWVWLTIATVLFAGQHIKDLAGILTAHIGG